MKDNDIIKALECCKDRRCDICERKCNHFAYESICRLDLIEHALYLINRQKAEIERLQKDCADIDNFARDICKERMLKGKPVADFEDLQKYIKKKRAEAIKEFAENVKKNHLAIFNTIYSHTHFCEMIDNFVKEMTEGKDES